jgi:hypothetical protein
VQLSSYHRPARHVLPKHWQALAWLLERQVPDSYSNRPETTASRQPWPARIEVVEKDGLEWMLGHLPGGVPPGLRGADPSRLPPHLQGREEEEEEDEEPILPDY